MTKSDSTIATSMKFIPKHPMAKAKPKKTATKKIPKYSAGNDLAGKV